MQSQNIKEYEGLRTELQKLKDCITTYVGFVAGGSAVAFWGLAGREPKTDAERITLAFVAVVLAIVASLVLDLLAYKFVSHNRYAGYSKLLTHERFEGHELPDSVFSWEICVDRLRDADADERKADDLLKEFRDLVDPHVVDLEEPRTYLGSTSPRDKRATWLGVRLLFHQGSEASGSWRFPLHVVRVFAAIEGVFGVFAVLYFPLGYVRGFFNLGADQQYLIVALVFTVIVLATLWMLFCRKLHRLMFGSETVEAFCWKFVLIRPLFLAEIGVQHYRLVGCRPSPFVEGFSLRKRRYSASIPT